MGHGVDSEAAGWVTDYMVITNNYRTYERGRRKEEEEGLRRRRSRAGRAANKRLSRCPESHAYVVIKGRQL